MILVFLVYALFASVFTISKYGLQFTEPFFLIGSRMVFAGALMLSFQWWFDPKGFKIHWKTLRDILLLGFFNIYLTNALEFLGLQHMTSFKTCFLYSICPFASALFSFFIFSERLSYKKWIGLGIGFVGLVPILLSQTATEELSGQLFIFSKAELCVLGAALSSVYGWILLRKVMKEGGYTPLMANGLSMTLGGFFCLATSLVFENWNPIPVTEMAPFLFSALALVVVSNFMAYNLYGYLLQKHTATFLSFAGFTTPLFTALFGWVFLAETVTWPFYISTIVVFSGLLLFYQEELKQDTTVNVEKIA